MRKWLMRILLVAVVTLVVLTSVVAGLIMVDAATATSSAELTNVTYTDAAGNELLGYLAEPATPGPHPAVLLIHEWWGLNEGMIVLADALAEQGYVVLAADAYRGKVTDSFLRAIWLVTTTPEAQAHSDLDAALAYLRGARKH
jgi:carboxymethylenebutenolidase